MYFCCAGLTLHLESLSIRSPDELSTGPEFKGNVLLDPSVKIGKNCLIGPDVCIGENCEIGDGVRLDHCVVMNGAVIKNYAKCSGSIVGWRSKVGRWGRLENSTVMGENVVIKVQYCSVPQH